MEILRAEHWGMCFGVRDAISLANRAADQGPVTILGDLVHNESVLDALKMKGISVERDLDAVRTKSAMITAHGASDRLIGRARDRGLDLLEATCPLVRFAHRAAAQLARAGYHPVIIGQAGHVEVKGLTEDLDDYDIVLSEQDVFRLKPRSKFGVISQTTQPVERVTSLVAAIRARFPEAEVRFTDTVCQPTKQRQSAAASLAQRCEVVVVIGGRHSNNTRELAATCGRHGARVFHVQTADEIDAAWFHGVDKVGITAGTSTPDEIVDAVEAKLRELSAIGAFVS